MKNKVSKSYFWYWILGTMLVATVFIGTYFIVRKVKSKPKQVYNWDNVPQEFKKFSEENAFKVELQTSPNRNNSYWTSSGTAWSWYYEEIDKENSNTKIFDWYLITNFHVVNQAVAYEKNFVSYNQNNNSPYISQSDAYNLLDYYYKNTSTIYNGIFNLEKYVNNNYVSLVSSNFSFATSNSVSPNEINSISIITDFNNNNVNLFSDSNNYNLDMSLIKIQLNLTNRQKLINYKNKKVNVIENYIKQENNIDLSIKNNLKTYIAGNPSKENQLIGLILDEQIWNKKNESLNSVSDYVLKYLKAPYYYSSDSFSDFMLTSGASGSSVYQVSQQDLETDNYLQNAVPCGIYWGGSSYSDGDFVPSFIPFIVSGQYNIFKNFIEYINI